MDLLLGNGELQESPLWLYLVEAAPREALMVTSLRVGLRVGRDEALEAFYAHHSKFLAECSRFYIYGEEALDIFGHEAHGVPERLWSVAKEERKPNDWTTHTTFLVPFLDTDESQGGTLVFGGWKYDANNDNERRTRNAEETWMHECSRLLMLYGNTHTQLEEYLHRDFMSYDLNSCEITCYTRWLDLVNNRNIPEHVRDQVWRGNGRHSLPCGLCAERAEVLLELRWINLVRLQEMLSTMKACGDTQHLAKLGCSGGETLGALVQRFIGFGSPTDPTEFMRFYQGPDLNVSFERGPYAVGDVVPSRMWYPHNEMHLPWDFFPSWV